MKHQYRISAKCPCYKCEERQEIFCKGPREGTALHLAFAIPKEKKDWFESHCKQEHSDCPILLGLQELKK